MFDLIMLCSDWPVATDLIKRVIILLPLTNKEILSLTNLNILTAKLLKHPRETRSMITLLAARSHPTASNNEAISHTGAQGPLDLCKVI